ncbi:MAG: YndJ family protein [Halobacteriales archaeon]|nr:YndJ family protein [Halobacteriales archaeon]
MAESHERASRMLPEDGGLRVHAYAEGSTAVGAVVWLGVVASRVFDAHALGNVEMFLALAVLVVVPLCLRLLSTPRRDGTQSYWYRAAVYAQPVAAASAVVSFFAAAGTTALLLALPWFVLTLVVAAFGLWRLLPRGARPAEELLLDAGALYLPVGGFWLVASRAGAEPLGFEGIIVTLTAVHFHYAGFVLPVLLGTTGRALVRGGSSSRAFALAAYGVVFSPGLVGIGIAFSPFVELVGVAVLAVSVVTIALLGLRHVVPELDRLAGALVGFSLVSVVAVVALGFAYASRSYGFTHAAEAERGLLDIPTMVVTHGVLASLGFGVVGATGWWLASRDGSLRARVPAPGVPFSNLRARWKVGKDFFERAGVAEETEATGMIDDLGAYDRESRDGERGFDADAVHPKVRDFYENTDAYEMVVVPEWERGFRLPAHAYKLLASAFENINPATEEMRVEGEVVGVADAADGRTDVRSWTRWDASTGEGILVGAYSSHVHDGVRYSTVGFPLPLSNFAGVLRFENLDGDSLLLTTYDGDGSDEETAYGDGGLYLVTPLVPVRLPLDERLSVRVADEDADDEREADIVVRHEMYLFGRRFVTLVYYAGKVK